ncbi:oxidoreductase, FADbinding domain containing protein [Acanthamoeba castellanii str. Neff]|uniref:Oxidoreductase, FADbinding domain containing protein n=1 Tax=Acanthamoeba castellanii (strain ATCC 30010 / Neff) TaxID=1257118 RepID=L8GGN4_ACACF|nr:oxidoreductase, FADbinding domain containing protein [Acanthamoeba castellanii str. Neff]ELR12009.1 oxidoreductase, FADbinding domain containing protein [Acanthamoeba castellanii str. Neff]
MEASAREWTAEEVAKHNTKEDCYVIVHGGFNLIFRIAGTDATKDFEGMFHSKKARVILEGLCVGTLKSAAGGKPGTAASSASGGFLSPLAIKSNMQASVRGQAGFIAPSRYMSPGSVMRPPPARSSERVPKGLATSSAIPGDPIHPVEWRRYTLVQVLPLNHNTKIFRFGLAKRDLALSLPLGLHIQVRAVIDGETVVRAYTPTSPPWQKGTFDLAVKRYDDGPLSRYIHELDVGQVVEMKGPKGEFVYTPGKWTTLAMICAGTGLTPMLQVIRGIFEENEKTHTVATENRPKIILIAANRREEDILFRDELASLQTRFPSHIQVHHLLSQPSEEWAGHRGRISQELLAASLPPPGEVSAASGVLLTYCGPTGFEVFVESSLLSLGYPVQQLFKF